MQQTPLLVAVVGPTGSGKSHLAVRIAEECGGEVVNCDSLQVYRGFDIGTAKIPLRERRGIPHHLIDIADPCGPPFTAGDYARLGRDVLRDIAGRSRIPVIAGGTGFYLRALLEGLFEGPSRDEDLRTRLLRREVRRKGSLHRLLRRFDPASAARIHANDVNKTMRALEVCLLAKSQLSRMFESGRTKLDGFQIVKIGLSPPRELLYERLNARAAHMFEHGLIEEVAALLASGAPATAKPFEAIGYKQALSVIGGRINLESAIESTQRETRQYAKRQWTWWRKDPEIHWLSSFGDDPDAASASIRISKSYTLI